MTNESIQTRAPVAGSRAPRHGAYAARLAGRERAGIARELLSEHERARGARVAGRAVAHALAVRERYARAPVLAGARLTRATRCGDGRRRFAADARVVGGADARVLLASRRLTHKKNGHFTQTLDTFLKQ